MSAIRSSSNRAEARKNRSTPYARAVVNKVFRFLGFVPADEVQELHEQRHTASSDTETDASSETQNITSENHNRNISDNGFQATRQPYTGGSRDPLTAASSFNVVHPDPKATITPALKLERSSSDKFMDADNRPQQRFSFTYTAPGSSSFSSLSDLARNDTPSSSSKKKLDRNPNGIYRWEGGGSAKHSRPRNRYSSPAFGASPVKPSRVMTMDNEPLGSNNLSDSKRRKVDERSQTLPFPLTASPSTPQTDGVAGAPTPRTNGAAAKARESSPGSRLRTPAKPTAPVNPSPLRQAWSDPAVPSPNDAKTSSSPQASSSQPKQTKTANLMAELIKETTPPKKPDLSNPYQTASPVAKIGPPRRGNKRTRVTGKATNPAKDKPSSNQNKEKEKDVSEYSQQAIIEATLPKGSKRSRPPAHFESSASSSLTVGSDRPPTQRESPVIVETRKQVYTVEEPDVNDEESPRKKSKPTLNGNGRPSSSGYKSPSTEAPDVTVEEVGDIAMNEPQKENEKEVSKLVIPVQSSDTPASASSPTSRGSVGVFKPSSIPKEPSKLRFSFQADSTSTPPSPAPPTTAPLPQSTSSAIPKSDFKFSPPSNNFEFKFKADEKPVSPKAQWDPLKVVENSLTTEAIKAKVCAMDPPSLPTFNITLSGASAFPSSEDHVNARNHVKSLPLSSLPVFEFGSSISAPFSFGFDASKPKPALPTTRKSSPPRPTKSFGNDSTVSLPKMPSSVFTFGDSVKTSAPPPVREFDFAAAGMKPPTVSKDSWLCSLCGLSNPFAASQCETCETPNPKSVSAPVKGFDFAAAGMKTPIVNKDAWICSLCSLSNPSTASQCETCEAPNPKAASAPAPVKGFDFAAAGMKAPTVSKGTWNCSLCGLSSPDSCSKCIACETPR